MVALDLAYPRQDLAEWQMAATEVIQMVELVARLMVARAALAEPVDLP